MFYASTAETVGIPYEWLSPSQMKNRWPLLKTDDLVGAIYHPTDGYINPAVLTIYGKRSPLTWCGNSSKSSSE